MSAGFAQKVEITNVLACEAGESIKPGASAPGQRNATDWARETGDSLRISRFRPLSRAEDSRPFLPGADAPGSTLPPASQARQRLIIDFLCKASVDGISDFLCKAYLSAIDIGSPVVYCMRS